MRPTLAAPHALGVPHAVGAITAAAWLLMASSAGAQTVPGFTVDLYSAPPFPNLIAFGPDGTLFEAGEYGNSSELKLNSSGHLLFVSLTANKTYHSVAGELPTVFFDTGVSPIHLTIAADDRIFTSDADATVQINAANGALINGSFAQFNGRVSIEFAQGGGFGADLLAMERSTGLLHSVSTTGVKTQIGSGFSNPEDIAVGPCGAIFVSQRLTSEMLRISKPPSPDIDGSGAVDGSDLGDLLGAWG